MTKTLFMLVAITANGNEYVWKRNMTDYQCHVAFITERNALIDVQEMHPEVTMKFECRIQQ